MVMDAVGAAAIGGRRGARADQVRQGEARVRGQQHARRRRTRSSACSTRPSTRSPRRSASRATTVRRASPAARQQYSGTERADVLDEAVLRRVLARRRATSRPRSRRCSPGRSPPRSRARTSGLRRRSSQFEWGGNPQLESFRGFITNVDRQLHRCSGWTARRSGPRSTITLTSAGRPRDGPRTRPRTPPTAGASTTVIEGDTLQSVAYRRARQAARTGARSPSSTPSTTRCASPPGVLLIPSVADAAKSA